MEKIKSILTDIREIFKQSLNEWLDDRAFKMAAALSFYSLISLVPILMLITKISGIVFGSEATSGKLVSTINDYVGVEVADFLQKVIQNAAIPDSGSFAYIMSALLFLWAAVGIFVELKDSLNLIWGVEIKKGKGLKIFLLSRIMSFFVILLIGMIFILFLTAGTILKFAGKFLLENITFIDLLYWLDLIITFFAVTFLFTVIMKFLPNVKVEWKYIFSGSIVAALLFSIGNVLVGIYLRNSYYSSIYGAAGSLVVFMFWIYYSSLIFFFSAEVTQVIRKYYSTKKLRISKNVFEYSKISDQIEKEG